MRTNQPLLLSGSAILIALASIALQRGYRSVGLLLLAFGVIVFAGTIFLAIIPQVRQRRAFDTAWRRLSEGEQFALCRLVDGGAVQDGEMNQQLIKAAYAERDVLDKIHKKTKLLCKQAFAGTYAVDPETSDLLRRVCGRQK
jgi:hypothetical protein